MNKYIKLGFFFVMSGLLVSSCDVMNTKPMETYTEEVVWGSKATADAFVMNVYGDVLGNFGNGLGGGMYASRQQTEGWTPNGCNYIGMSANGFSQDNIDRYADAGFNKFALLRKCNTIIEKANTSTVLSPAEKKELIAEGHMLRGLIYFYQAKTMGRFVPINKVLSSDDSEAFQTPITASVGESYKYVIADLKAGTEMPSISNSGRMNKYVAHAFLSEAALQAYAYTKDENYLDLAISSADEVIKNGGYSLESGDKFGSMFLAEGKNSKEIILGVYRLAINTEVQSIPELINGIPNVNNNNLMTKSFGQKDDIRINGPEFKNATGTTFVSWLFHCPTQDVTDAFLVVDKKDGKAKKWNETSQFIEGTTDDMSNIRKGTYTYRIGDDPAVTTRHPEAFASSYTIPNDQDLKNTDKGKVIELAYRTTKTGTNISELIYNNRDKRFYSTIVYDSCMWFNELVTFHCNGNLWAEVGGDPAGSHRTISNYLWRKGAYHVSPNGFYNVPTDYHTVVMRLGRVYLNKAEALLLKGQISEAVELVNKTRVEHGGLPKSTAANEADAWADYKTERRADLAYENDYYWSLLRWGQYGGGANHGKAPGEEIYELTRPVHKIQINTDRTRLFIQQIVTYDQWKRNFTPKRYLLPIPQGYLDKRAASGLVENNNPGW